MGQRGVGLRQRVLQQAKLPRARQQVFQRRGAALGRLPLPGARLYAGLRDGSVQLWAGAGGKSELAGHTYEARNSMGEFN
ncbi:hypothetical protein, partial [Cupriavidus sp.]|uniref:hypothetical protein n=1 Tax=Cupriavidus sp. TaxID=1873897 RepID=UPI0028BDB963